MVRITGHLHINTGFIRIKPNINFIGALQGTAVYDLSNFTEIELNPTPVEGVYLVDYAIDSNAPFLPSEHWIVPNKDCTFDDVRGIKNPDSIVAKLEEQIEQLKKENAELVLQNKNYLQRIQLLEQINDTINQVIALEETDAKLNTSLNILSRF